jgi:hypothetical protein
LIFLSTLGRSARLIVSLQEEFAAPAFDPLAWVLRADMGVGEILRAAQRGCPLALPLSQRLH